MSDILALLTRAAPNARQDIYPVKSNQITNGPFPHFKSKLTKAKTLTGKHNQES